MEGPITSPGPMYPGLRPLVGQGWLLPESLPAVLLDALEADIPRR